MSRAKLFLENFFAYGFINVLNKIIPFLLLPVITRMLSDPSDYGVYDMYNTIIGFGAPLAMLGMYDAIFREYFEKDEQQYRFDVISTANRIVMISSLIIGFVLVVFNKLFSKLLYGTNMYGIIVVFAAVEMIISTNTTIISAPTRIQNHRKVYISSGLFNSISYYLLAILLIYLGYSYFGMIYANIASSVLLLIFFWMINRMFFARGKFDKYIAKELFKVGIPLLPTFLIYWVYHSMDKIMIANMLGTSELGSYSIGARVASISNFIYAAFTGGWQHFAFSTMKDEDQVTLNSKVFEYLGAISFFSLFVIYPFITPIFNILFPISYIGGKAVVSYLYLSPLLLMLFQVVGNQFLIIKRSYWSTITLSIGALANITLNAILIPIMGVEGAAIATLMGYTLSVIAVCIITSRFYLLKIPRRIIYASIIVLIYMVLVRMFFYESTISQVLLSVLCIIIYLYLYKKEIYLLYKKGKSLINMKDR